MSKELTNKYLDDNNASLFTAPALKRIVVVSTTEKNQAKNNLVGWQVCALLAKKMAYCSVELIHLTNDLDETITVATSFKYNDLGAALGLSLSELFEKTSAGVSLAEKYVHWRNNEQPFYQSSSSARVDLKGIAFHQFTHYLQALSGENYAIDDYSFAIHCSKQSKLCLEEANDSEMFSYLDKNVHCNSYQLTQLFRDLALSQGVTEKLATIGGVEKVTVDEVRANTERLGFIKALLLSDGERLSGDFFIDCTGQALLTESFMQVASDDLAQTLPSRHQLTLLVNTITDELCTKITATEYGYYRRIPLQRMTEYQYYFDENQSSAKQVFHDLVQREAITTCTQPITQVLSQKITSKFWYKNCLAVGNSAISIELFGQNDLDFVYQDITRWLTLLPLNNCEQVLQDIYNRSTKAQYLSVIDFVSAHFKVNHYQHSPYWLLANKLKLSADLSLRKTLFLSCGKQPVFEHQYISDEQWNSLFTLLGYQPDNYDQRLNLYSESMVKKQLGNIKQMIEHTLKNKLTKGISMTKKQIINNSPTSVLMDDVNQIVEVL